MLELEASCTVPCDVAATESVTAYRVQPLIWRRRRSCTRGQNWKDSLKVILSVDSIRYPLTGIGRYTFELARHLKALDPEQELRFLRGRTLSSDLPAEPLAQELSSPGRRPVAQSWRAVVARLPLATGTWRTASVVLARRALSGVKDHVLHGPGFYLPSFAGRSVVTMHDLSIFRHPAHHPAGRVRFMRSEIAISLRRADHVITVSEFGKRELMDVFGWPEERATAIPLAAGAEFHPRDPWQLSGFLAKRGLQFAGFSLFVGTLEPRKNLGMLLDAYRRLPAADRAQWPLVLAGFRGWESDKLHERIQSAQAEGWLHYLGFLSAEELPLLYAAARLFVFP